jgi:hypothetical protein
MRLHPWIVLLGGACAVTADLSAQGAAPIFDRLQGEWVGTGTLLNRAARFSMQWRHQDGFAVLTFANGFADTSGAVTPVLNAAAVYRTGPARPEGVWLDSRGTRVELQWESSDSLLAVTWTAPTERGRTTYRVRSADEGDVLDEVLSNGEWRTFGTARYRRTPAPH